MPEYYDSSWDLEENEDALDAKFKEWEKRSWEPWLRSHLKFPFAVKRVEDEEDAYFSETVKSEPFRLGHVMNAADIDREDDHYGILFKAKEGRRVGYVPLCEVEVVLKKNENYWPVREYAVWFANREWF